MTIQRGDDDALIQKSSFLICGAGDVNGDDVHELYLWMSPHGRYAQQFYKILPDWRYFPERCKDR